MRKVELRTIRSVRDISARRPSPPPSFFVFDGLGFGAGGMFLFRACQDPQPRPGEARSSGYYVRIPVGYMSD